jgi:hypothetical protein
MRGGYSCEDEWHLAGSKSARFTIGDETFTRNFEVSNRAALHAAGLLRAESMDIQIVGRQMASSDTSVRANPAT